jgi:hypothetical protein
VSIDELTWNGDKMNKLTFTREGPKQIKNFDPYRTYKALTVPSSVTCAAVPTGPRASPWCMC